MRTLKLVKYLVFVTLVFFITTAAEAQSKTPKFSDYPVKSVYTGKNAPIKLNRDEMAFRTRLRWAATHMRPNFAGHYIVTEWGCGAECRDGAVIDARTGKVSTWGFTICCWPISRPDKFEPVEFRINSNLIVFTGLRNEKEGDNGKHFYKFQNGRFIHIKSLLHSSQTQQ
jgi:hypothetical protein